MYILGDYWNVIGFPQLKNKREIAHKQTHTYILNHSSHD